MTYLLAALPILLVLGVMIFLNWNGQRAGALGWVAGLAVAGLAFGLNWPVLWVSQLKGLFLSFFVLAILWPALLFYKMIDQTGGIQAIARALEAWVGDRGLLLILLAWAFSGLLEGLAGFGLPIAIVAPMLAGLGVPAVQAVAAVAVGHVWAVTFGDMSVVFQTLMAVTGLPQADLAPLSGLFLGAACLLSGLACAAILGYKRHVPVIIVAGVIMAAVQYAVAVTPLVPLAVLAAGLAGILAIAGWARLTRRMTAPDAPQEAEPVSKPALWAGLGSYGLLTLLMCAAFLIPPVLQAFRQVVWQMQFPQVTSQSGFLTPAGGGQALRPLIHPGFYLLITGLASGFILVGKGLLSRSQLRQAARETVKASVPVSVGILFMIGLSSLMEHTGMTLRLAEGLSLGLGALYPLISPLVGVLGAFATGSNNNSNVLFAPLQQNAALLLKIDPRILLAAQTTGGALGSMIAPAKILVGCSTAGILGKAGQVLRTTLPYCLAMCALLGLLAWALA